MIGSEGVGSFFLCTESSSSLASESLFICWASSAASAFGATIFTPSSEPSSLMASWGLEIEPGKFDDPLTLHCSAHLGSTSGEELMVMNLCIT